MNNRSRSNLPASVHQRLLTISRSAGDDANMIFARFANERLLFRLTQSQYAGEFVLKGAAMFLVWNGRMHRPTLDLDLQGFGEDSAARMELIFRECCNLQTEADGLSFDSGSVKAVGIREGQEYQGKRVTLLARLGFPCRSMSDSAMPSRPTSIRSSSLHCSTFRLRKCGGYPVKPRWQRNSMLWWSLASPIAE